MPSGTWNLPSSEICCPDVDSVAAPSSTSGTPATVTVKLSEFGSKPAVDPMFVRTCSTARTFIGAPSRGERIVTVGGVAAPTTTTVTVEHPCTPARSVTQTVSG